MVTGLVEAGEDITVAAEREVLEETGVRAKFDAVLAFRQAHGFAFGKSDFFFVVALRWETYSRMMTAHKAALQTSRPREFCVGSWLLRTSFH